MLELIIISSLAIIGLHVAMWDGMILNIVRQALELATFRAPWLRKPLYACPPCMTSIYGSIIWFASGYVGWEILIFLPAVAGLNYFIISLAGGEE
jgi:hypothetical protein